MNIKALSMVILCTLFTAIGQIFFKIGSSSIFNPNLYFGFLFYFMGALLLTLALSHDKLSSVYPFIALSFIWVFIFGAILFRENVDIPKLLGTFFIVGGVFLVGGSK